MCQFVLCIKRACAKFHLSSGGGVSDLLGSRNLKFVRDDIVSLRRIAAIEHLKENCQWSMQLKEIVLKNLCQDDKSVVNC